MAHSNPQANTKAWILFHSLKLVRTFCSPQWQKKTKRKKKRRRQPLRSFTFTYSAALQCSPNPKILYFKEKKILTYKSYAQESKSTFALNPYLWKKKKALGTDKYKVADNESKFKIDININLTRISSGHDKEKRLIFTGKNTLLIEVLEATFC